MGQTASFYTLDNTVEMPKMSSIPKNINCSLSHSRAPPPKMATMPSHGLRHVTAMRPWLRSFRSSTSVAALSSPSTEDSEQAESKDKPKPKPNSYFPKRGQTLELVCESLAFKGKGLCRVSETGFVVMCDRALPGERFIGRVTRRKGTYAEVRVMGSVWFLRNLCEPE